MSISKKDIAKKIYLAIGSGDVNQLRDLFAPDYSYDFPFSHDELNQEGRCEAVASLTHAMPDLVYVIESQVSEGDEVMTRGYMHGTHSGPFMDGEPSGNHIHVPFASSMVISGAVVTREWELFDTFVLLQQMGFIETDEETEFDHQH